MDEDDVDDEGVECEDLFGVPAPGAAPGVICPDGAHDDACPEEEEGEFDEDHGAAVEDLAEVWGVVAGADVGEVGGFVEDDGASGAGVVCV